MIPPISPHAELLELDETESTQDIAGECLGRGQSVGAVWTHFQTDGRGRFGRSWISPRDSSLTVSFICSAYADHQQPYLVGMAIAIAAAEAIDAELRWPNDLSIDGKKVAGILTELMSDPQGRKVPVVGLGMNLNQTEFPEEIQGTATSVSLAKGGFYNPREVLHDVLEAIERVPEPTSWSALMPRWSVRDKTPGKIYKMLDGNLAEAITVGPDGELIALQNGLPTTILAADAIFGRR